MLARTVRSLEVDASDRWELLLMHGWGLAGTGALFLADAALGHFGQSRGWYGWIGSVWWGPWVWATAPTLAGLLIALGTHHRATRIADVGLMIAFAWYAAAFVAALAGASTMSSMMGVVGVYGFVLGPKALRHLLLNRAGRSVRDRGGRR